jgi:hypothetical protein
LAAALAELSIPVLGTRTIWPQTCLRRPTMQHSRLTGSFTILALTLSWLTVPHWANMALAQSVPADLAAQYGTTPSPELGAAIEYKIEAVKAIAQDWAQQGRDPSAALALMTQVPAAMSEGLSIGNLANVEALIDQAYALLMAPP